MENNYHPHLLASHSGGERRGKSLTTTSLQATQFEVLEEGGLDVSQVFAAFGRRLWVIVGITGLVTGLAVLKGLSEDPVYEANFEILTKPVSVESQLAASVPQSLSGKADQPELLDNTALAVLQSPKILLPVAEKLKASFPDVTYRSLLGSLTIGRRKDANVLQVSYQDSDAHKVKAVVDAVSQAYIAYSLEERQADVRKGIQFVESQLPQLQTRVNRIQLQLQEFRQRYNLVDPTTQGEQLTVQVSSLQQQQQQTQLSLKESEALYRDLSQQITTQAPEKRISSALNENAGYQKLVEQVRSVDLAIAQKSTLYTPDSPTIKLLQEERASVVSLMDREAKRVRDELGKRLQETTTHQRSLETEKSGLIQDIKQLSWLSRQYTDIQRELKIATDNLDQFLAKREALKIDAGQQEAPWQILTPPGNPFPSSLGVKRIGMLGAGLGLILGLGAALLVDRLKNVFYTSDEVKDEVRLPILGVIPYAASLSTSSRFTPSFQVRNVLQRVYRQVGVGQLVQSQTYTISPFHEAFNSLYTNIRLLSTDTPIRSIVVSSPGSEDGKSTVSVHLAQVAASLGQRVLLVDLDLRRPRLHERLGLSNHEGISELITADRPLEQVIQPAATGSSLYVLTSGKTPPDPLRLLSSHKMADLIQQLEAQFDLVIYDMPPMLDLADVNLIAPKTDGLVLVVGLGHSKRLEFKRAIESLRMSPTILLGLVANGSQESRVSYGGYLTVPSTQVESPVSPRSRI